METLQIVKLISSDLNLPPNAITNIINLTKDGATVPFIARYRKEMTGALDEVSIRDILDKHEFYVELDERKTFILKSIESQKKLTPELAKKIEETMDPVILEDLYLPYKPKKKTKGTVAKERGLEPLALTIWQQEVLEGDPNLLASKFINPTLEIKNLNDVFQGAIHILAEMISDNPELRQKLRGLFFDKGIIKSSKSPKFTEKLSKFDTYFNYAEKVSELFKERAAHRYLAVTRGENENVLSVSLELPEPEIIQEIETFVIKNKQTIFNHILEEACKDAFKRLIEPSLVNEIRSTLKTEADIYSIKVFAKNLKELLLFPPFGSKRVLALDPAFRTGCKTVVLGDTGEMLEYTAIFPHEPQKEVEKSEAALLELIKKHNIPAIVIGNGTASRETHTFVRNLLTKNKDLNVISAVISESGASVYSASDLAREEFPNLDVTVRGAISIGRRFQDPLAELVKVDPKAVGVGQYQHDVNQPKLKKGLEDVVTDCVNYVGVDINLASTELLSFVSGIGPALAHNIIEFRKGKKFTSREDLKAVSRFTDKVFEQAVGFMRIVGGKTILDNTGIHPETYYIVDKISKNMDLPLNEIVGNFKLLNSIRPHDYTSDKHGEPTVRDIIEELKKPGRDPRRNFEPVEFMDGVFEIKDLKEGMIMNGIVTNVTNFGAFVDIGVHNDGLVHTSEIANRFVADPSEAVFVGEKVTVKVIKVDLEKEQISLSIKQAPQKKEEPRPPRQEREYKPQPQYKQQDERKFEPQKFEPRKFEGPPPQRQFDKKFEKKPRSNEKLTSNPFADLKNLLKK